MEIGAKKNEDIKLFRTQVDSIPEQNMDADSEPENNEDKQISKENESPNSCRKEKNVNTRPKNQNAEQQKDDSYSSDSQPDINRTNQAQKPTPPQSPRRTACVNAESPMQSPRNKNSQMQYPYSPRGINTPSPRKQLFATTNSVTSSPSRRIYRLPALEQIAVQPEVTNLIAEKLLKGESVEEKDPNVINAVINDLEETRDNNIIDGNVRESMSTQKAIEVAKDLQLQALKKQAQEEYLQEVQIKKQQCEDEYNKLLDDYQTNKDLINEQYQKQLQALKDKQAKALEAFDAEWHSEAKLRQYNRPSASLRQLRAQQQLLIQARRFEEAQVVADAAEKKMQIEAMTMHKSMVAAYQRSRESFINRQLDDQNVLKMASEKRLDTLNFQFKMQVDIFEKRARILSDEESLAQDPEKVWAMRRSEHETRRARMPTRQRARARQKGVTDSMVLKLPPLPDPPWK